MKKLYSLENQNPFRLSRSKIELFLNCPYCFYLDRRLGISRPSGPPFTLNNVVDTLLKKEFDIYRQLKQPHPLMVENKLNAIPFTHDELNKWRNAFKGIDYIHSPTNLWVFGGIDDVWVTPEGQLIIVDYKATGSSKEIISLNEDWHQAYKRQVELYSWLFTMNGFKVFPVAYFVYCQTDGTLDQFNHKLEFKIHIIEHALNDSWIDATLFNIKACLSSPSPPARNLECSHCIYLSNVDKVKTPD